MERYDNVFAELKSRQEGAFVPFVTLGDPGPEQSLKIIDTMIEAGADLVAGHGPHVLRAVECYMGRPIAYSLGNFVAVGGLSIKQMANVSAILQMTISPDGVLRQIEMLPLRFDEARVPLPDSRGFALHLLNQLGRHARYPGTFVEFPAPEESKKAFDIWFAENAPK